MPRSTSYFRSAAVLNTCSRYAVRYGDVNMQSPGQYAKPPFWHWKRSSSFSCLLRRRPHLLRVHARQRERVAEIRGQHERQRARAALLGAAVGILDQIARAFAEADHRGRRQLDVQTAEARHDAGRDRRAFPLPSAPRPSLRHRRRRSPATRAPRRGSRPRTRRSRRPSPRSSARARGRRVGRPRRSALRSIRPRRSAASARSRRARKRARPGRGS